MVPLPLAKTDVYELDVKINSTIWCKTKVNIFQIKFELQFPAFGNIFFEY